MVEDRKVGILGMGEGVGQRQNQGIGLKTIKDRELEREESTEKEQGSRKDRHVWRTAVEKLRP